MAAGTYTLLDLATRSGAGVHSLMEGVLTYAPELMVVPTFPKAGITYTSLTRTELPTGDFRKVGAGTPLTKSVWKRETGSMALFDANMRINEDIVVAARAENPDLKTGDILADEAIAHVKGSAIRIGSQFWYGTKISADGFAGLSTQVDTTANQITAGTADGSDSSSVYLVYLDNNVVNPEGVHFFLGNGGRMSMAEQWAKQQIEVTTGKFAMAYVNNFLAYLGLVVERPQAVYRCKGVDATHPFTDALGAELLAKVPLALRQDKSKWRWFMNSTSKFGLQKSRQATLTTDKGIGATGAFPAEPTHVEGIAIQDTDSLITTERAGLKP